MATDPVRDFLVASAGSRPRLRPSIDPLTDDGWARIESALPGDWRRKADEQGLLKPLISASGSELERELLLRILLHYAQGRWVPQTTTAARTSFSVDLSAATLDRQMRRAEPWLNAMASAVLCAHELFAPSRWGGYAIYLTDTATGLFPGKGREGCRALYRVAGKTLRTEQLRTVNGVAIDSLECFDVHDGDLDLVDRWFCARESFLSAHGHGGQVIARVEPGVVPLLDKGDRRFDLRGWLLEHQRRGRIFSKDVKIEGADALIAARVIAHRSPRRSRRSRGTWRDAGDRWAPPGSEYTVLFTTAPAKRLSDEQVVALHTLRTQVLCGRRGLAFSGNLQVPTSMRGTFGAWVSGKILLGAIERKQDVAGEAVAVHTSTD